MRKIEGRVNEKNAKCGKMFGHEVECEKMFGHEVECEKNVRFILKGMIWFRNKMFSFWDKLFRPVPVLTPKKVILGLVGNVVIDGRNMFDELYDIEKPLRDVARLLGYGHDDDDDDLEEVQKFVDANINSSFALACLRRYLDTVGHSKKVLIFRVKTKDQHDLIKQFGGHTIDISHHKDESYYKGSRVKVDGYEFELPPCLVTAEADHTFPVGCRTSDIVDYVNTEMK